VIEEADQLRLAREGDLNAFNALVHEHQSLVFSLCLRQLGQRQAAEDATQEAFLAAWRNLPSLRGPLRPWLLRIALNACTDEQRRRGRRRTSSLDSALEEGMPDPPDAGPMPENAALTSELHDKLELFLRMLPEDQRLAVVLCDVEGLEYAEIASALGTNLGTVKSRIARGRARLRELLRAEPELLPGRYRQISRHERD
jgi:RNA polymerase sigma-70 factor (ECF subfamily)